VGIQQRGNNPLTTFGTQIQTHHSLQFISSFIHIAHNCKYCIKTQACQYHLTHSKPCQSSSIYAKQPKRMIWNAAKGEDKMGWIPFQSHIFPNRKLTHHSDLEYATSRYCSACTSFWPKRQIVWCLILRRMSSPDKEVKIIIIIIINNNNINNC